MEVEIDDKTMEPRNSTRIPTKYESATYMFANESTVSKTIKKSCAIRS